jgi:predicted ATPase
LYPFAISVFAAMMRSCHTHTGIASTQSVPLVNEFDTDDLIVLDRVDTRPSSIASVRADRSDWLDKYKLPALWQKKVLRGKPSR